MDTLTPQARSLLMSKIRSKNTKPEMIVRKLAHSMGLRFRLHKAGLPGKPDLVFAGRRKVIQIHGCFWHQHAGCVNGRMPKSRREYWVPKLMRNVERDHATECDLERLGWGVMTIWECQTKDLKALRKRLCAFLRPGRRA